MGEDVKVRADNPRRGAVKGLDERGLPRAEDGTGLPHGYVPQRANAGGLHEYNEITIGFLLD